MKKLEKDILVKVLLPFFLGLLFFVLGVYLLFKHFTLEVLSDKSLSTTEIMSQFNFIWLELSLFLVVLVGMFFFILKKFREELLYDINELTEYLQHISQNKNYDAIIHIKNYMEFLQISIQLKNIIKRVYKKDKK